MWATSRSEKGVQVDAVLGLSMTPTSVGLVLVEGQGADGATMDRSVFEVRHGAIETAEQAAEAVRHTEALAATRGLRLHSIGVTWSEGSDAEAALLMRSLSESGFDNVVPVRMPEAAEALARGIASVMGYETTAVCVVEPETALTLIVRGGDGAVQTAFNHAVGSDEALIDWLSSVFERADWQPEALVVVGSAGEFASILPDLELALSVPAFAPDEAELALARGAALASAQSIAGPLDLDDGFTAFGAVSDQHPPRTAARRLAAVGPVAMLVAGAVTFVVSVSLAVSLQLNPHTDQGPSESVNAASERQARVNAPQAPVSVRPKPPAAIAPAPAAPPPPPEAPALPEAPPVDVAPPEAPYLPEAQVADQIPAAAPEYPPVAVPPVAPALAPPAMPPPVSAPYPTKKPGILTRIRDKLRIGDDNPAPPPVPPVITVYPGG
jgi:hypothetical protein